MDNLLLLKDQLRNKNIKVNLVGDWQNDLLESCDVLCVSHRGQVPWNVHVEALARTGAHLRVVAGVAARVEVAVIEPMQRDVKHSIYAMRRAIFNRLQ